MRREDVNRAMVAAESWTEAMLVWQAGLPTPLTVSLEILKYATFFALGVLLS